MAIRLGAIRAPWRLCHGAKHRRHYACPLSPGTGKRGHGSGFASGGWLVEPRSHQVSSHILGDRPMLSRRQDVVNLADRAHDALDESLVLSVESYRSWRSRIDPATEEAPLGLEAQLSLDEGAEPRVALVQISIDLPHRAVTDLMDTDALLWLRLRAVQRLVDHRFDHTSRNPVPTASRDPLFRAGCLRDDCAVAGASSICHGRTSF